MHAARNLTRIILFALAFSLGLVATAPPMVTPPRNPDSFEVHALWAAGTPEAVVSQAVALLEPATLGWRYAGTVRVYDGTGGKAPWKVPEAVSEWQKNTGLTASMTSDPTTAQVAVYEVDQFTDTSLTGALGVSYYPSRTNGIATSQCRIELDTFALNWPVTAEHTAIHELGHCLGLAHNTVDKRTVMAPKVQLGSGYTRPQSADLRNLRTLYP